MDGRGHDFGFAPAGGAGGASVEGRRDGNHWEQRGIAEPHVSRRRDLPAQERQVGRRGEGVRGDRGRVWGHGDIVALGRVRGGA